MHRYAPCYGGMVGVEKGMHARTIGDGQPQQSTPTTRTPDIRQRLLAISAVPSTDGRLKQGLKNRARGATHSGRRQRVRGNAAIDRDSGRYKKLTLSRGSSLGSSTC